MTDTLLLWVNKKIYGNTTENSKSQCHVNQTDKTKFCTYEVGMGSDKISTKCWFKTGKQYWYRAPKDYNPETYLPFSLSSFGLTQDNVKVNWLDLFEQDQYHQSPLPTDSYVKKCDAGNRLMRVDIVFPNNIYPALDKMSLFKNQYLNDANRNISDYEYMNKIDSNTMFQKLYANTIYNFYNTQIQNGKDPFQNQSFVELLRSAEDWNYFMNYLPFQPNTKNYFIEDYGMETTTNGCTTFNYDGKYDTSKGQYPPATVCSRFKSNENNNFSLATKGYLEYLKKYNPNRLNTLIGKICKNEVLWDSECKCYIRNNVGQEFNRIEGKFIEFSSYNNQFRPSIPASCWYPPCIDTDNWIDRGAYPENDPTEECGNIRYCRKVVNYNGNTDINSIVDLVNKGCSCDEAQKCPKGKTCIDGKCQECQNTQDCIRNGLICVKGECTNPLFPSDCPKDYIFKKINNKNICVNENCENITCPPNQECISGKCRPKPTPSPQPSGQPDYTLFVLIGIVVVFILVILLYFLTKR